MRLVAFHPAHLARVVPPAATKDQIDWLCRHPRPAGPAWTCIDDAGRVIGCAGIVVEGDAGRAWAILSHPVRAAAVHRLVARRLDPLCGELGLKRIEARARLDWPGARRWLERLGFRFQHRNGDYGVYER